MVIKTVYLLRTFMSLKKIIEIVINGVIPRQLTESKVANMAKCDECGKRFNVSDARSDYNDEFDGELNYDEEYGGQLCADCAISDTSSNINLGRAIDMMNGDEDYDDDFVREHL